MACSSVRRAACPDDPAPSRSSSDVRRRDARLGRARRRDRAFRLPAAAKRTANRAAHQRSRRRVFPREQRATPHGSQHYLYNADYPGARTASSEPLLNTVSRSTGRTVNVIDVIVLGAVALPDGDARPARVEDGSARRCAPRIRPRGGVDDGDRHRPCHLGDVLHRFAPRRSGRRDVRAHIGDVYFLLGFIFGLKAFTAAVVGGIGSIPGAMLGGILIGLIESFAAGYAGGQWSQTRRLRDS